MSDSIILPGRKSITDTNPPRVFHYIVGESPKPVKLFTFGPDDDPNIKMSSRPFILTCSLANYPELRVRFAQLFTAFVARINQGACGTPDGVWNDVAVNPCNPTFQDILRGNRGSDTEVFVIPLRRDKDRTWLPCGGVKFVTSRYAAGVYAKAGSLNLISGYGRVSYDALHIDIYESGRTGNDYVSGVMGL